VFNFHVLSGIALNPFLRTPVLDKHWTAGLALVISFLLCVMLCLTERLLCLTLLGCCSVSTLKRVLAAQQPNKYTVRGFMWRLRSKCLAPAAAPDD
jgi:hypothetical protein